MAKRTLRNIRIDDDLWERFAQAVAVADPEGDRSKIIRRCIRWYIGDTDDMPPRPADRRPAYPGGER